MFSIHLECPHCGGQSDFNVINLTQYASKDPVPVGQHKPHLSVDIQDGNTKTKAYAAVSCPECRGPVLLVYELPVKVLHNVLDAIREKKRIYTGPLPRLLHSYPEIEKPISSEHYPDKIKAPFEQAQKQIREPDNEVAAMQVIMLCRGIMDVALKEIQTNGDTIYKRIESAREKGSITQGLSDWAHHLRLEGNNATHDLGLIGDIEEARELVEFLRLFLEVVFVLPRKIAEKRQQE
uniref:DUF4145 domain-containing protein n=1 Tax=Candidatus Kentrum sp. TC TaxID=2126339 RepID=A0A450YW79_9GAMM|nr:MAG: protein of unknown function (DUF4145) [Candidatus Kentron sp. TC]